MDFAVDAARWAVCKALAPVTDGLLESWAASTELGSNIDALKMQLLYAQGMLDNAQGRDIRSPALKELLHKLRHLAYGADDALDELEYFRIQDALDGTYHAAALGCTDGFFVNARHTARAAASKLKLCSRSRDANHCDPDNQEDSGKQGCLPVARSCCARDVKSSPSATTNRAVLEADSGCTPKIVTCARSAAHSIGKHLPCYSFPSVHDNGADTVMMESSNMTRRFLSVSWPSNALKNNRAVQAPKLKFDRVKMSTKMMEIVDQLKPLCAMVSTILDKELLGSAITKLDLLGFNGGRTQASATNRPKTTPNIIEPELYGRNDLKKNIVDGITHGIYCTNELTVVPLVGPGGIGKTTLTQHIYREVESSFQVSIWICVSLDFNADRLLQEVVKKIPKVDGENENASNHELIERRLKSKRLLLVLDDVWTYHEDEWKKLLAPLRYNGGEKGNVLIVTTRIPKVASMITTTNCLIDVERLGHTDLMSFFEVCVFGDQRPWKEHPELRDVGSKIVNNLKGFPLAAKTVGRLLRNQLTLDHWTRVAESRECELQTNEDDIMPALKLSYDYLPFHLQQCFFCCALFPEDYEFCSKELVHFWIGLGILHPRDHVKRIEDVGLCYLNDLVNHGFFKKNEQDNGPHYAMHDLLHDLAVKVSSHECLSIYSSSVRFIQIPASVRHLSIIVDDTDVVDITTFKDYISYLSALGKRLEVQNLRTLMLFGGYHGSFVKTFRDLFREARALRVLFLSGVSYSADDLLLNFSELVHLRYLRIKSVHNKDMCLPSALFRFYHLEILDLENWGGSFGSTTQMSNLVKLRHFLLPVDSLNLHSNICEVGKLKLLTELRRFEVGKENKGFELSQLGELTELGGSLGIYNLEKVGAKEEGKEVKLIHKKHLHKLILEWDINPRNKNPLQEENVLESLVPHKNLRDLCIRGHGGIHSPSWLGGHLAVENLESLSLYDVSWNKFPPLGDLWSIDDLGVESQGCISSQSFQTLKILELVKIPRLKKWVGNGTCHIFSLLEEIIIEDCPELTELPFSHPACCQQKNMTWFPKLRELKIVDCPKLSPLPPIPWTPPSCSIEIARAGSCFEKSVLTDYCRPGFSLEIKGKDGQHSVFWNGFAFHNLAYLNELEMENCPPLPLIHIQKLKSLKTLRMTKMGDVLLLYEGDSHNTGCPIPVECIEIGRCGVNGKELTQFLSHFPKIMELEINGCEKITGLGVVEYETTTSSSANKIEHGHTGHHQQLLSREDELASEGGEPLLLPPQLHRLWIWGCRELRLLPNSLDNYHTGGGLQRLCSLQLLTVETCPKFLSSYSSSSTSSCFPFPNSLQKLTLWGMEGTETLVRMSNLISLTSLSVNDCGDLRGEGLRALVNQGRLTELQVCKAPNFFAGSESSRSPDEQGLSCSSKLSHLKTDDLECVLTPPIFSLLFSSSLTRLSFRYINKDFTEEQEAALHLLTFLQILEFWDCKKLRHLPAGLTKLTSLKILDMRSCTAIRSLPQDGLPTCLQELVIMNCPAIKSLPKDGLPSVLQELTIINCPAIKSLPNDALPSSLRELHVRGDGISEELKRQCRKLKGTIPIIRDYRDY